MFYIVFIFSLPWDLNVEAQDITLERGKQTKVIKAGTYVEVVLKSPKDEECDICQYNHITGRLVAHENNQVLLEIKGSGDVFMEDGKIVRYTYSQFSRHYADQPYSIPVGDIIAFVPRGKKKIKSSTTGETIGIGLAVIGMGHLVSSPFGRENGVLLLGLGLGELILGTTIGTAFQQKTYPIHSDYMRPGKDPEPLWALR